MKLMPGADVWFHPGAHELQLLSDQPLAAKVTYVHHSGLVNLIVWGRAGETFQRASVPFWDADDARDHEHEVAQPKRADTENDDAYNARMTEWHRVRDRPTINHASWIDEGSFEVQDGPHRDYVSHHPFEGRPSGGVEDLERARAAQVEPDARQNMDHGRPRGSASPNSGGPLALDDHEPLPDHPAFQDAPQAKAAEKAKADKEAADAKAKAEADADADAKAKDKGKGKDK